MPFPITCAACQKAFSIADDVYERKVKGRVVTIKCKQCQAGIRVDGTKETPVFSLADDVRPQPVAAAAPAPAVAEPELPSEPATTRATVPKAEPLLVVPKLAPAAAAAKAAPVANAAPKAAPVAAVKAAPAAVKAAPAAAAAKAAATPAAKAQPVGVKPPPAAPALKIPPAPVAAAPVAAAVKAPVATATPKAPPVAVQTPPAAPALKAQATTQAVAAPVEPPTETLWAVDYPDGEDRELTRLAIQQALTSGAINPTTLVWREGMDEWLELGQVPELKSLTEPARPAAAPPQRPKAASAPAFDVPPQRPKAASAPAFDVPPQRPRAATLPAFSMAELSATLPQVPAELPLPPQAQRPPAPSAPVIDFAPRGAPAAPAQAPIPKLPISARTPPSFPASPGLVAAAANPFSGGMPAHPFGHASPTPFGAVAPVTGLDEYPSKSKTPLIVGSVAFLAVAAGAIFFLTRSSDELPPPAPISALPAAAPTTVRTAAPEPAPTQDAPTTGQPTAAPGSNAALQDPSTRQTTPNAGFAELFARDARAADEKHGVTGPTQRFDPAAAKAALTTAAGATAQCREKGGPAGKASVVVTFEASGKVSTATVSDAPFAGTSSGACIAAALKQATVPPFSGLPGSVTKIISIQ
ncbi:MAG: GYF domain-containing protein [Polyangiaceae bacterium]